MEVIRTEVFETNDVRIGDRIAVELRDLGNIKATAQKVTDKGILFLFDEVIAKHPMNETGTNVGGFDESGMKRWLRDTVLPSFPEKLRCRVTDITLPTYGQIFGHEYDKDFYTIFEPDEDEQFELMKRRGNRICDFEDDWYWWLRNATKQDISSAHFAVVYGNGNAASTTASYSHGVRPEFWLVR